MRSTGGYCIFSLFLVIISSISGFIFFCQVFAPVFTIYSNKFYIGNIGKLYTTMYDVWNLNFFNSFEPFHYCISPKIRGAIPLIAMDYLVALYPLLLTCALYCTISMYNYDFRPVVCLCRPVHHCVARMRGAWSIKTSITHALAAFLLLSFIKFTVTSYNLLAPSYLYNQSGHIEDLRVYYDGTMELFKGEHIFYGSIAIFTLAIFVVLPTLVLLLFPFKWFHLVLKWISFGKL